MSNSVPHPRLPGYRAGSNLSLDTGETTMLAKWVDRFITAEQDARGVTDQTARAPFDEEAESASRDIARFLASHWDADTAP